MNCDTNDSISLILSIVSIVAATSVVIWQVHSDRKMHKLTYEQLYFDEIFKNYLIKEIPKARGYISFNNKGELIGTDKLIDTLKKLKLDSLYYSYARNDFYKKLAFHIGKMEDFLVSKTGKEFAGEAQADLYSELKTMIESLYGIIRSGIHIL